MKNKSFTLIELLVVIVIIGILAGVIMISTSSSIDKANTAKAKVFSESVRNSLIIDLTSEWKFDNLSSFSQNSTLTINIDSSLPANTKIPDEWGSLIGTAMNGPILKGGKDCVVGECLEFSRSVLSYVQIGNGGITPQSFTIEFFFKKNAGSEYNCFTESADYWTGGYHFWNSGSGFSNRVDLTDTSFTDNLFANTNWNHLVLTIGTIDATSRYWNLYLNGQSIHPGIIPIVATSFSNMKIGYSSGNSSPASYFNGKIDEFRLYKGALSSSQVKQNYIAGLDSLLSNGNISKEDYNNRINELAYEK